MIRRNLDWIIMGGVTFFLLGLAFLLNNGGKAPENKNVDMSIRSDSLQGKRHFDTLMLDSVVLLLQEFDKSQEMASINITSDSLLVLKQPSWPDNEFRRDFCGARSPDDFNQFKNSPIIGFANPNGKYGYGTKLIFANEKRFVALPFDMLTGLMPKK